MKMNRLQSGGGAHAVAAVGRHEHALKRGDFLALDERVSSLGRTVPSCSK